MRRTADRLCIFAAALAIQSAVHYLLGPPPERRPSWLAWAIDRASRTDLLPPRLRVFAPVFAAVAAARLAAALERTRPDGSARAAAILLQAAILAATFDAWRAYRAAGILERELAADPDSGPAGPDQPADGERIEAELGRLAQGANEGVVGAWSAYVALDLSGAVAYAAADSLAGAVGGADGPLAGLLDSRRQLTAVRRARDAIASAATLAARGRGQALGLDLDDIAAAADTPPPVAAMTVVLNRRITWEGRVAGWRRPAPDLDDLRRGRRLALRSLGLLAAAAMAGIALSGLLRPDDLRRAAPPDDAE